MPKSWKNKEQTKAGLKPSIFYSKTTQPVRKCHIHIKLTLISSSSKSNSPEKTMASHSLMFQCGEYGKGVKADTRRTDGLVTVVKAGEGEGGVFQ